MKVHCISETNSILNVFVAELRDINIQKDPMRFRRNLERTGEILSYEMSKHLNFSNSNVETPLGINETPLIEDEVVICSILRAGLPLHIGVLNYFDRAENAFISAYRKHEEGSDNFEIIIEYAACPDLTNKTLLIVDPMLATGQSITLTYDALLAFGEPKSCHIISVIGAQQGVDYVNDNLPKASELWIGAIDDVLNSKGYILPGLGDAGDLAFGPKCNHP